MPREVEPAASPPQTVRKVQSPLPGQSPVPNFSMSLELVKERQSWRAATGSRRLEDGQVISWSYSSAQAMRPFQIPALVLQSVLNDINFGMKTIGQQTLLGTQVNVVRIAKFNRERALNGTPQLWYFSAATGLPVKVEYLQPSERAPEVFAKVAEVFSDFESQSGLLIPMSIQMELESDSKLHAQPLNLVSTTDIRLQRST
jgi:hypothetical protein